MRHGWIRELPLFNTNCRYVNNFIANCDINNLDDLSRESMMADKMRDAWINCRRLSRACVRAFVCLCHGNTFILRGRTSHARIVTKKSTAGNGGREKGKGGSKSCNPRDDVGAMTNERPSTSSRKKWKRHLITTLIALRYVSVPPPHNPPSVVIASLMSWEKPPQLQINRSWSKVSSIWNGEISISLRWQFLFYTGRGWW